MQQMISIAPYRIAVASRQARLHVTLVLKDAFQRHPVQRAALARTSGSHEYDMPRSASGSPRHWASIRDHVSAAA
jgi:hypothetical protein